MTEFIAVKIHYDHRADLPPHLKYSRIPTPDEYKQYLSLYHDEGIGGEGFHECLNFSIPEDGSVQVYFPPGYIPAKDRLDKDFVVFSFTYQGDRELGSRIVGVHGDVHFLNSDGVKRHNVLPIMGTESLFYHAEAPSSLTTLLIPPVVYDVKAIPLHTSLPSIPAMWKKATIRLKIRQIERFLRTFGRCRSCLVAACHHEIFA